MGVGGGGGINLHGNAKEKVSIAARRGASLIQAVCMCQQSQAHA